MSGIKGVIKYISQLLILSSFSIIFLPIICLKCYEEKSEISIFKFMQWSMDLLENVYQQVRSGGWIEE